MIKYLLPVLAFSILFGCRGRVKHRAREQPGVAALKLALIEADRDFSVMSEKRGLRYALMEFIDSSGVLLRPGMLPLTGANAMDFIAQGNDSSYTMTWEPQNAAVAADGSLGYTYGVFSLKQATNDSVIYGTYVTVWKHQPDGRWKFVLQSGNEGVEDAKEEAPE